MSNKPQEETPEKAVFVNLKVREHVPGLIEEVQETFRKKRGIKPPISDALVNALKHYKAKLQTEPAAA
jgi:hypothetical protein